MECYSAIKKEWNNAICSNMDRPWDYHAKWNKPDRERQIWYCLLWNLKKKIQMNLFTKQNLFHRHRKQTYGYPKRGKEG